MSESKATKGPTYRPEIFEVNDLESAMQIILTPETGTTTQERWEYETPYLVNEIGRTLGLDQNSCVLDYGCGVGRIARGLIERYHCFVIGVDISTGMRQLAPEYVKSDRFSICAPAMLDRMIARGLRVTHAYACWVLQHCLAPETDLARIDSALVNNGTLFVLNSDYRFLPTDRGWGSDGISVEAILTGRFEKIAKGVLPEVITTPELANTTYTMTLRKRIIESS
jgi:SAM-dependent methyltransferase